MFNKETLDRFPASVLSAHHSFLQAFSWLCLSLDGDEVCDDEGDLVHICDHDKHPDSYNVYDDYVGEIMTLPPQVVSVLLEGILSKKHTVKALDEHQEQERRIELANSEYNLKKALEEVSSIRNSSAVKSAHRDLKEASKEAWGYLDQIWKGDSRDDWQQAALDKLSHAIEKADESEKKKKGKKS